MGQQGAALGDSMSLREFGYPNGRHGRNWEESSFTADGQSSCGWTTLISSSHFSFSCCVEHKSLRQACGGGGGGGEAGSELASQPNKVYY
jgi:hypothetical protein